MTAEQLHAVIRAAYPSADALHDYAIQDDGAGPYLSVWTIAGQIPTGVPLMAVDTPMARWIKNSVYAVSLGAKLVDELSENHRLKTRILALIAATDDGAIVEGGSWTKEEASRVMGLWGALATFLDTPITEGGPTPLEIITDYA